METVLGKPAEQHRPLSPSYLAFPKRPVREAAAGSGASGMPSLRARAVGFARGGRWAGAGGLRTGALRSLPAFILFASL